MPLAGLLRAALALAQRETGKAPVKLHRIKGGLAVQAPGMWILLASNFIHIARWERSEAELPQTIAEIEKNIGGNLDIIAEPKLIAIISGALSGKVESLSARAIDEKDSEFPAIYFPSHDTEGAGERRIDASDDDAEEFAP